MILADKIIQLRKKNGWSQEELANQLNVSRQAVSKWEGAQAIPDIQKIIKLAELFGVSTDYLLRDDMEPEGSTSSTELATTEGPANLVRVSMEEANEYLELIAQVGPRTSNAVSLCIFGPALLLSLIAASVIPGFPVGSAVCVGIGLGALLILVAIAVFFFIVDAASMKHFEYLEKNPIETMYGVSGMVKEKKKESEQERVFMMALGVILCIVSPIPLISVSIAGAAEYLVLFMVATLLLFVCAGVNLIIRSAYQGEAYDKLLQEGGYTLSEKKKSGVIANVGSIYWALVVAIYLGWSFLTFRWDYTWIIWPVAGVLFGAVTTITHAIAGNR